MGRAPHRRRVRRSLAARDDVEHGLLVQRLRSFGRLAALPQHDDPVAAADDLLDLRGDEERPPRRPARVASCFDLGLGADVDAARRLVEDEQLAVHAQPAGQQHLLLVAAGELADRLLGDRAS